MERRAGGLGTDVGRAAADGVAVRWLLEGVRRLHRAVAADERLDAEAERRAPPLVVAAGAEAANVEVALAAQVLGHVAAQGLVPQRALHAAVKRGDAGDTRHRLRAARVQEACGATAQVRSREHAGEAGQEVARAVGLPSESRRRTDRPGAVTASSLVALDRGVAAAECAQAHGGQRALGKPCRSSK